MENGGNSTPSYALRMNALGLGPAVGRASGKGNKPHRAYQ